MLSPNDKILVKNFAEQTASLIVKAIKTKKITKYGAVNSSGRLAASVEIKYTDQGFQILANNYIIGLIWGRRPGSFPPISAIESWIKEKPISSGLPTRSLAFAIATKMQKEGNMVWRTHKGANSGLLSEPLAEQRFDTFIDLIASSAVDALSGEVFEAFEFEAV